MERKRLVADRFRRIWAVIEYIASHPGCSRRDLADRFALSERQLQADLNVIRLEMGLPLVRRQGYRFVPVDQPSPGRFGLSDAYVLGLALNRAAAEGAVPREAVRALAEKLPEVFPSHLRPFLRRALAVAAGQPADPRQEEVFAVLARAMQCGAAVRLRYRPDPRVRLLAEPILNPELVLPYLGSWYVIGQCHQNRKVMMFALDTVAEATLTAAPGGAR